jgi:hypothetical protein
MKASMNTENHPTPPAPQQAPQHYLQPPPPMIFQNPIPHQGIMNTQQEVHPTPPPMWKYKNPGPLQLGNLTITINSSPVKRRLFKKHVVFNTACL